MDDNTIVLQFNVQSYAQNFKMLCLGFAYAHGGVIDGRQFIDLLRAVNSNDWHTIPGRWVKFTCDAPTIGWITESQLSEMTPVKIELADGSKIWEMKSNFSRQLTLEVDGLSSDSVNHPNHYVSGRFEAIDIIEDFCSPSLRGRAAFDNGSAIKYILRWHRKNGIEDLKKAMWYIQDLIKQVESEEHTDEISTATDD